MLVRGEDGSPPPKGVRGKRAAKKAQAEYTKAVKEGRIRPKISDQQKSQQKARSQQQRKAIESGDVQAAETKVQGIQKAWRGQAASKAKHQRSEAMRKAGQESMGEGSGAGAGSASELEE